MSGKTEISYRQEDNFPHSQSHIQQGNLCNNSLQVL
jgi:hypothetical protein